MLPAPTNTPQPTQTTPADQQQQQDRNRQRGTGFTNLNRVLSANQGAGQKMGQQIGTSLSSKAGDIRAGIQAGQQQFGQQMQAGSEQANKAIAGGQALQQGANETQEAYTNRLAGQGGDLSQQGQALRGAAYQGPQGLQQAGQLQSQSATASALGRLGATAGGQQQLLASQVAQRGKYGLGQSALDRALVGREGQQAIQQGRATLSGIEGATQGAVQGAQSQATANAAAIEANKTKALQTLQNQLSGTGEAGAPKGFTQLAKEQAAQYNTQAGKLQQMLSGINPDGTKIGAIGPDGKPTPSQYSQEDVALLQNMKEYGLDPNQMIYGTSAEEQQNYLGQLGTNANLMQNERYMGQQGAAANALATFLGDQQAGKLGTNKFEAAFNPASQQNVAAASQKSQEENKVAADRANQLAQMKQQYDALYNASGGGTKATNSITQQWRDQANQILAQMRSMGADPNRSVGSFQSEAAAHQGTQKSALQLALERLGQTYTPPTQTDVTPSQTKVQK